MHYVYLLQSKGSGKFYIGSTADLRKRLDSHNKGLNLATKADKPWVLIYYEAYANSRAALIRERKLKHHGKGLSELKKRLNA